MAAGIPVRREHQEADNSTRVRRVAERLEGDDASPIHAADERSPFDLLAESLDFDSHRKLLSGMEIETVASGAKRGSALESRHLDPIPRPNRVRCRRPCEGHG